MPIWVDADACPTDIKKIIFKAAMRRQMLATFVANHKISIPKSPFIRFSQVSKGFDVADHAIVQQIEAGHLLVTADIPLAAEVIELGALALSPRGQLYTTETIGAKLNMRDFMDTMRSSGIQSSGPPPLNQKDIQAFANALDRWLAEKP